MLAYVYLGCGFQSTDYYYMHSPRLGSPTKVEIVFSNEGYRSGEGKSKVAQRCVTEAVSENLGSQPWVF